MRKYAICNNYAIIMQYLCNNYAYIWIHYYGISSEYARICKICNQDNYMQNTHARLTLLMKALGHACGMIWVVIIPQKHYEQLGKFFWPGKIFLAQDMLQENESLGCAQDIKFHKTIEFWPVLFLKLARKSTFWRLETLRKFLSLQIISVFIRPISVHILGQEYLSRTKKLAKLFIMFLGYNND